MRVLLINPPAVKPDGSIWRGVMSIMPPLGLAWIAAVLERGSHEVVILDAQAEQLGLDVLPERLRTMGKFSWAGLTATTSQAAVALEIAKILRVEQVAPRIVMGGVHPTILPAEILECDAVDVAVRGEGEATALELCTDMPLSDIAGVSWRNGDNVVHNPERELLTDLNTLPMPAYHLLPMELYHPALGAGKRLPAVSVLATRGCPGRCTFCYRIFGHKLRVRSGRKVAEEVKQLQDRYGIKEIAFYDDTFTAVRREVFAFCEAVLELKIDLTWSCFSRTDTVCEEMLQAMKDSGCHQVMFGIENASEEMLRLVHKKLDLKGSVAAVKMAQKVGMDVRLAFMFGNPGETMETMENTLQMAIDLNSEYVVFNITTPYPGTEMFRWAKENNLLLTEDWERYDLAHPVMELPTVSSEDVRAFYRKAYRRYYLRWGYIWMRLKKIRSWKDIAENLQGVRAVFGL